MPEHSRLLISMFHSKRAATEQGGLLNGQDPTVYNPNDPLRIWIIQVGIIICLTQLLSLGLKKLRQPRVIAEVLGGILLGPTALGRIPGFTDHIFPSFSVPYLTLVANIGLALFLFLVGLEIDASIIKRNARLSVTVALAGMALPFGLGAGLSVPLYHHFIPSDVKFTNFMLFTGVAYSITAFPVLCRILTELKLLDTTVGIVVLSAGVGNDIVGWTLLALSVALVNGGAGTTAVYILLTCVGWALFLLFVVRRAFSWLARKTGSVENGPTKFFMTIVMVFMFASAFFTDVIGVHAIFGAFLTGIIVPREGGLAIALTEKLEDMVSIIFLPLYFTISGLSTNLGLLNDGITWGFTIAIVTLAYSGKFGGCTLAARTAGFGWREASTIGTLMSCKGLVELIVLNVGLSAGILTQKVFSMFVFEALLLTFMTTPVVATLYPPHLRTRATAVGGLFGAAPDGAQDEESKARRRQASTQDGTELPWKGRFTVVLDKIEHMPGMMAMTQLIQPEQSTEVESKNVDGATSTPTKVAYAQKVSIEAFRLMELEDRMSAAMKSSASETLLVTDPLLGIFRMYAELNDLPYTSSLSVVQYDDLPGSVAEQAQRSGSDLILLPWLPPMTPVTSDGNEATTPRVPNTPNPFDTLFGFGASEKSAPALHSHFVRGVFSQARTDVALFIDRGHAPGEARTAGSRHHILFPFFGGPDDRLALDFVVQLCANSRINATVVRMTKQEALSPAGTENDKEQEAAMENMRNNGLTVASATGFPDTVYGQHTTETRMQSETADSVSWGRYAEHSREDPSSLLSNALARIEFKDMATSTPLHAVVQEASALLGSLIEKRERLLVVVGRSRRLAVEDHHRELKLIIEEQIHVGPEVKKTVGDVATALVASSCKAGIVVLQAAGAT